MTTIRWRLALVSILMVPAGLAQTPTVQDLQNKLLQFEESTQKTIAELKAQIAALQQGTKGRRCRRNRGGCSPRRKKFQSYILRWNTMAPKPGPEKRRERTR